MKQFILSSIVLLIALSPGISKDLPIQSSNYDLAQRAESGNHQGTDQQWSILYLWEDQGSQTGDPGTLGICFDGELVWVSGRGVTADNMMYMFDPATGLLVDSWPTGTSSSWGIRDMCWDGEYIYGGEDGGLRQFDITTHTMTGTIPIPAGMSFQRANAFDPSTDHFYCGNFGGACYEQDRNGNLIRTWSPAPLTAIYGMAWDYDAPDGPWLWVLDQMFPFPGCNIHQVDPVTLSLTGYWVNIPELDGGSGLHYCSGVYPIYTTMLVHCQGVGYALEMYMGGSPPVPMPPSPFAVSANGADLSADLEWINPTLAINGSPLNDLDGIIVERDDVVIADVTGVQIGEPSSYIDNDVPVAGLYIYQIYGYNQWGDGAPAYASSWIGPDVPCAPGNFTVIPDPGGALENTLTWEVPDSGAHGAYFTGTDSYNLYRALQGDSLIIVADLITGTSTIDEVFSPGWYEYGIAGVNGSGEGEMTDPIVVYCGPPEFEPIPFDWFEISQIGTNTGITGDDQNLGPFDMGFNFPWYDGTWYNSIRICSNGWFSFTSSNTNYSNQPIPTTAEPNNLVAPYWDDFYPPDGGNIWYYQDTANDRFIIEFEDINHISGEDGFYFQTIFYPDGDIDFMYQHIGDVLNSCTVGKENGTGSQGVQVIYNGLGYAPEDSTGIRLFAYIPPPPPDIDIVLTPQGTPILIPAGGGNFEFNIMVSNNENIPYSADIWTEITLPSGNVYGPIINVSDILISAGSWIERDRIQTVPAGAPAGGYTYDAYGGFYPSVVFGEDHFDFEKSAVGEGTGYDDWYNWGEAFPGEVLNAPDIPSDYSLSEAYPNPFNPVTRIGYSLPERAQVELVVYDVSGREVQSLVNGHLSPGNYEAVFDGNGLATGVYFYRLTAGEFNDVKKMVLVK